VGRCHAPAALPPRKTLCPLYKTLGGVQGRSGRVRKSQPLRGFDPRTVQPVASRYMDRAIPAHWERVNKGFFSCECTCFGRSNHLRTANKNTKINQTNAGRFTLQEPMKLQRLLQYRLHKVVKFNAGCKSFKMHRVKN
jgi:hypothetical protein